MNEGHPRETVFNKPVSELSAEELKIVSDLYKSLVEMADRVSQRRQNANNFYLSVNTALVGASAYASNQSQSSASVIILSVAGLAIAALWRRNIDSYKDLNSGKFRVITELEKALPIAAFKTEWDKLGRGTEIEGYRPFHKVEGLVPYVFALIHAAQLTRQISWSHAIQCLTT